MGPVRDLDIDELLSLSSLGEILGGFAHELAQPLNAIMIASQVVQLKIERSSMAGEEKDFLRRRLGIVASQVQRATAIVESLRAFIRRDGGAAVATNLKEVFDRVYGLMEQQFISRGITVSYECGSSFPIVRNELNTLEGLVVQGLAYARQSVAHIARRHEEQGIPFERRMRIRLFSLDGRSTLNITWDTGSLPEEASSSDAPEMIGVILCSTALTSKGGSLETSPGTFTAVVPQSF